MQVVGSQARILYSDQEGRVAVALAFNKAVRDGKLKVCNHDHFISNDNTTADVFVSACVTCYTQEALNRA